MFIPAWKLNNNLTILWDITYQCNLNCKHCFVTVSRKAKQETSLSEEETGNLLSSICSGKESIREFNIQGGEPLCASNLCYAIRWLGRNGIPWSLNTNGVLWSEEHTRAVREYPPLGITVSLDGHNAELHDWLRGKGTFDALMSTIQILRTIQPVKEPIQIDAICVLHKRNVRYFKSILGLAAEIGIREIVLNNLSICGAAERNRSLLETSPDEIFSVLDFVCQHRGKYQGILVFLPWATPRMINYYNKKYGIRIPILNAGCQAIRSEVTISPRGHLRPCPNALDRLRVAYGSKVFPNDAEETRVIGKSLTNVRTSHLFAQVYDYLHGKQRRPRLKHCSRCVFFDRCTPCPSQRFVNEYPTEKLCFAFQNDVEAN